MGAVGARIAASKYALGAAATAESLSFYYVID